MLKVLNRMAELTGKEKVEEHRSQHVPLLHTIQDLKKAQILPHWRVQGQSHLLGQPNVDRIIQRVSLLKVSNTLAMSMKMVNNKDHVTSTVVLMEPHCALGRFSSDMLVTRRLRMTQAKIFLAVERREMPQ